VVWLASPTALVRVAPLLPWRELAFATATLVIALYLGDSLCVRWLFAQPGGGISLPAVLYSRGASYLLSSLNYELGQGAMAWALARIQNRTLLSALGMCLVMAYHDVVVLLVLGLSGALLSPEPLARVIAWSCGLALLVVAAAGVAIGKFPLRWQERWLPERLRVQLDWWTWRHSICLGLLRTGYFALILVYAAVGLRLSGIDLSLQGLCSVVPLALLADGLPISVSGLGTRETTLLYLINPDESERPVLLAFSLLWSVGLVLGRAAIGLAFWWYVPERRKQARGTPGNPP
jgi:hypothetical protein